VGNLIQLSRWLEWSIPYRQKELPAQSVTSILVIEEIVSKPNITTTLLRYAENMEKVRLATQMKVGRVDGRASLSLFSILK
jgi:hypothetical protein